MLNGRLDVDPVSGLDQLWRMSRAKSIQHPTFNIQHSRLVVGLGALLLLVSCTTRVKVPASAKPCADACAQNRAACVSQCEVPGRVEVLDKARRDVCEQRCGDEYD